MLEFIPSQCFHWCQHLFIVFEREALLKFSSRDDRSFFELGSHVFWISIFLNNLGLNPIFGSAGFMSSPLGLFEACLVLGHIMAETFEVFDLGFWNFEIMLIRYRYKALYSEGKRY